MFFSDFFYIGSSDRLLLNEFWYIEKITRQCIENVSYFIQVLYFECLKFANERRMTPYWNGRVISTPLGRNTDIGYMCLKYIYKTKHIFERRITEFDTLSFYSCSSQLIFLHKLHVLEKKK